MADNTQLNTNTTSGDIIATDDIGGVKHQRVKITVGADGVSDGDVATGNPMPTDLREIAGTAVDANAGTAGAGTQRVVIATDQAVLSVDDNSGSLTVDAPTGTPVNVQIGDGTDQATVTAGGALNVDGSAVTQPVSAASLPLPSGAATAANQLAADHAVDLASEHARNDAFVEAVAIGGELDDTTPVAATEGNVSPARITAQRALHTNLRKNDGTELGTTSDPVIVTDDGSAILVDGSGVTQPVSAASLPLPSGAATAAAQLPDGHNVTVDNTTGSPANVQIGDGSNQATIRNLAANDALNVSIVDGAGDQITTFGGGTQYDEDDAAAANPTGTVPILIRQDTPATLVTADGDNVAQRATNYGAAFVQVLDSSGNFINSFGGSGGTSHADDAAFTIGSASSITPMGALADETTPDSVDEGDVGVPRMTLDRKLLTRIVGATDGNRADVDSSGHLQVDIAADSVGIGGGTQYTEDAAAPADPVGNMNMAVRRDTPATETNADGDVTALSCTPEASLNVELRSGTAETGVAGNPLIVTDDGSAILVDGSGVTQPVSGTVTADAGTGFPSVQTEDAAASGGETGSMVLGVRRDADTTPVTADGDFHTLIFDNAGALKANVKASALPTGAATAANQLPDGHNVTIDNASGASAVNIQDGGNSITVDGTVTANAGTGTRDVGGDVAHDSADSGNPVSTGYNAAEFAADPPQVSADNDRVRGIATPQGIQWTLGGHPNIVSREFRATTAQTNADMLGAVAAGSHVVVTGLSVMVDAATTVDVGVRIGFGATAVPTEPADGAGVNGMVLSHPGIAAGSGVVEGNGAGVIAVGGDGEELRITSEVPTTGSLKVLIRHFVTTL